MTQLCSGPVGVGVEHVVVVEELVVEELVVEGVVVMVDEDGHSCDKSIFSRP